MTFLNKSTKILELIFCMLFIFSSHEYAVLALASIHILMKTKYIEITAHIHL